MEVNDRLKRLLERHGWTMYELAKRSGLASSTIANIYKRNTVPSIATLEAICKGFGITLSQFFADDEPVELSPDLRELFDEWAILTPEQKALVLQMIRQMH